jgi:hypothetical protein
MGEEREILKHQPDAALLRRNEMVGARVEQDAPPKMAAQRLRQS